jgi:type II secretory pathway pseudopilin PulG
MEVLVVCAILVVLAGVGGVIYMQQLENAKKDIAKTQLQVLTDVVEMYKLHNGEFPPNLAVLTEPQADGGTALVERSAVVDPWYHEYILEAQDLSATGKPLIYSAGPGGGAPPIRNRQ